jgi:hypothetical protein
MLRAISVGYVLVFFLVLVEYGSAGTVLPSALYLLVPLLAIWFPEETGSWLGPEGLHWLRVSRPALFVQRLGWALLFLAPLVPLALG